MSEGVRRWDSGGRLRRRQADETPTVGSIPRDAARSSYYGVPVIHGPHWKWLIVVYFFLGGVAGGTYAIASIADLVDPRRNRRIVRAGRYLSLVALLPSPVLLILDLHRPERFYRMLRVLKLRSPMSIGTWALTAFGGFCGLSAVAQAAEDRLLGRGRVERWAARLPARALGAAGTPLALLVIGYTGVLLAATAVPLWTKRAMLLGPIFLVSALSTATAAISAVLAGARGTPPETLHRLERLEAIAILTELSLLAAWVTRLGVTAAPLASGTTGVVLRHGVVTGGLLSPLALHAGRRLAPAPAARPLGLLASLLVLSGGFALRYVVVVAGRASADDPHATFDLTRDRNE